MFQLENIILALKQKGQRITKVRSALINILINSTSPLDIADITNKLSSEKIKVNKSTLYREIEFLINFKIIKSIDLGEGKKRYEIENHDHHHHLICTKCKNIWHFVTGNELSGTEKLIKKTTNFKVSFHALEFFGVCSNCSTI